MLLLLALALIILWGLAFFLTTFGAVVHILLVLAVIVVIVHFVQNHSGSNTAV